MKTFKIALITLFTTLFFSCDNNDDGFYNSEFVTIPNLVTIETQTTPFAVNDFIYVNSYMDRLQTQQNQATMLDLRKSTGNANRFNFTFQIEKKVGNEWQFVTPADNEIDSQDGEIFSGGFFSVNSVFNAAADEYQFRAGIKLTSAGQYRLSFGYNSSSVSAVELRSQSSENNIFLNITSTTTNTLDGNGYYNFIVN